MKQGKSTRRYRHMGEMHVKGRNENFILEKNEPGLQMVGAAVADTI